MANKGSKFNTYSYEFKVQAVEDYLSGKSGGIRQITKKYRLKSTKQIRDWTKKYKEDISLLGIETRGRNATGCLKSVKLEDMTLEEQNQYLRMENDILKKLKALQDKFGEL